MNGFDYAGAKWEEAESKLIVPAPPPDPAEMKQRWEKTLEEIRACEVFGFSEDLEFAFAKSFRPGFMGLEVFKWDERRDYYRACGTPAGGVKAARRWIHGERGMEFLTSSSGSLSEDTLFSFPIVYSDEFPEIKMILGPPLIELEEK